MAVSEPDFDSNPGSVLSRNCSSRKPVSADESIGYEKDPDNVIERHDSDNRNVSTAKIVVAQASDKLTEAHACAKVSFQSDENLIEQKSNSFEQVSGLLNGILQLLEDALEYFSSTSSDNNTEDEGAVSRDSSECSLPSRRQKKADDSDEDEDLNPADALQHATDVESAVATEKTVPVDVRDSSVERRRTRRAAANASIIRNRELLNDKICPELYMQEPWRLYDSIIYRWVPYHYGDERDKRDYQYGDEKEGERHFARVIGFDEPYWRVEYEVDGREFIF